MTRRLVSVLLVLVALLAAACASPARNSSSLADEPTPTSWAVGSEWAFSVPGRDGASRQFFFRITDATEGQWRVLEVLQDPRPCLEIFNLATDDPDDQTRVSGGCVPSSVSARVDGDQLEVSLMRVTDVESVLVGRIDGRRFQGVLRSSSFLGESVTPGVEGWRSR